MAGECETGTCEVGETSRGASCGKACPCGSAGCSGDPMDCAIGMWTCAFFEAMKQTQTDYLKAKIQKAWGAKMDKVADAVLEAMGAQWQSMLAQAKAKDDVRERLRNLWHEGR